MNKRFGLGMALTLVLIVVIGYFLYAGFFKNSTADEGTSSATTTAEDSPQVDSGDENADDIQNRAEATGGRYTNYHKDDLVFADEGSVVLFFSASWCPTCNILMADLDKNRADIPEDLLILRADYDTETELKQKYEVTYQHTLVQVDGDGDLIKKWSNSFSLDDILDEVRG